MENNIYLIKDLARLSGQTIHTIKYYLNIGLIKEIGRSPETNFRYFNKKNLEELLRIRTLRREHKSLAEIREILEGRM
ncbi:MAG: MerR family transcriptional regulator [Candidatus Omnitrophota bacterium]